MKTHQSAAWPHLRDLAPGDPVPAALYVLDYEDGTRPRWTVADVEELATDGRCLILVDRDNWSGDLFEADVRVALMVLTWPHRTMRSQPYALGGKPAPTLCNMDQQGRRDARRRALALEAA